MRVAWIVFWVYIVVVIASAMLPIVGGSPIAGVYAVLLTLPWSGIFVIILDAIRPTLVDRMPVSLASLAVAAAINGAILFWITSIIIRVRRRRAARRESSQSAG